MTLILLDGLEDMSSWVVAGAATTVAARNGNGARLTSSSDSLTFTIPSAQEADTVTIGFAVKFGSVTVSYPLVEFRSDAGATLHDQLRMNSDGSVGVTRSSSPQLVVSTVNVITVGPWYYIEVQIKMHDTTGFVTVRVNGTTVASGTSLDTKNAGTKTTFDTVKVLGFGSSATPIVDDLYLMTGTGDSFQNDILVETLYPNGNGNANQWLGSDADSTNNYLLVNETGTPNTTNYVGDSVSGHQDLYALSDLVHSTGTVVGVCHSAYAALSAAGSVQVKLVNRRSSDTKSAAFTLASTSYAGIQYTLAQDPETSAAWTVANVNALQSGVEVV